MLSPTFPRWMPRFQAPHPSMHSLALFKGSTCACSCLGLLKPWVLNSPCVIPFHIPRAPEKPCSRKPPCALLRTGASSARSDCCRHLLKFKIPVRIVARRRKVYPKPMIFGVARGSLGLLAVGWLAQPQTMTLRHRQSCHSAFPSLS